MEYNLKKSITAISIKADFQKQRFKVA